MESQLQSEAVKSEVEVGFGEEVEEEENLKSATTIGSTL